MRRYLIVALLCIAAFFVNNTALLPDIMEARNLVTAREMVTDGNWLVPTMNGNLRLEKPPLPTWIAAVVETVAPDNLAAQRAAAGVAGVVWVVFFFLTAKQITRREDYAYWSTLVFITCYQVVLMGRTATWDIYCHATMMGAIYFLWRGLYDEPTDGRSRAPRWLLLAGLMMGLSFMSKGPVSFYALLLPFLIAALWYKRPQMRGKWLWVALMVVVCVVISSWWYVFLRMFHNEELQSVIAQETGSWVNRNVRPWYYYWRFFTETGAWTLLTLAALAVPYWKRRMEQRREYLFAVVWVVAALVLLSLMPEKKMRYLLPMMVPCSLAVGFMIEQLHHAVDKPSRLLLYINGAVVTIVAIGVPVAAYFMGLYANPKTLVAVVAAAILLPAIGVWVAISTRRLDAHGLVYGVVAIFVVAECLLMGSINNTLSNPGFNSIAQTRTVPELRGLPFYHAPNEELRIELVYDAHRKILPLNLADSAAVARALPCVVVTRKAIAEEVPAHVLRGIETIEIGVYDNNRLPPSNRHYNPVFLNHVTLLKTKQSNE